MSAAVFATAAAVAAPTVAVFALISTHLLLPLQHSHIPYLSLPILTALHATRIALEYRRQLTAHNCKQPQAWLQGLVAVCVMSVGGTTASAMLVGEPPGWLVSNTVLPTYALVYALVCYSPNDVVYSMLEKFSYVIEPMLVAADGAARSLAQTLHGVELVRRHPSLGPSSYVAQIIIGTLAGVGGGIMADGMGLSTPQWVFRTPRVFETPTVDIKTAVVNAGMYTVLTSPELMRVLVEVVSGGGGDEGVDGKTGAGGIEMMGKDEARAVCAMLFASALLYKRYGDTIASVVSRKRVAKDGKEVSEKVVDDANKKE